MLEPEEFAALLREVEARAAAKAKPDPNEAAAALGRGMPCFQSAFMWLVGELEAKTNAAAITEAAIKLMGTFAATIAVNVATPGQEDVVLAALLAGASTHAVEALRAGPPHLHGSKQ